MKSIVRLACWSGPRNVSTALLRSWGNRANTVVCDEPLYAHYLLKTGLDHPGREEIIQHHDTDWRRVSEWLTGDLPEGKTVFYQKHMAHHLLPEIERDWLDRLTHWFLVREPRAMLASLGRVLPRVRLADTGLEAQVEIFRRVRERTGSVPPVIDSRDLLGDPRGVLSAACERAGVPFDEAMLSWPAGPRDTDGIWAKHWYGSVETSTGFRPHEPKHVELAPELEDLASRCEELHDELHRHRLTG